MVTKQTKLTKQTDEERKMYCIVNPNLFKPFTSKYKKIVPKFSDDWEIIPKTFNSSTDITIKSTKLDVEIAGFAVYDFLSFLKEYSVETKGLKIVGEFCPGQDRKLYSRKDYDTWRNKYEKIVESKFSIKDLKIGMKYRFKCGKEAFYIGAFKNSKGKNVRYFGDLNNDKNYDIDSFGIYNSKQLSGELKSKLSPEKFKILLNAIISKEDIAGKEKFDFSLKRIYDCETETIETEYFMISSIYIISCSKVYELKRNELILFGIIIVGYLPSALSELKKLLTTLVQQAQPV